MPARRGAPCTHPCRIEVEPLRICPQPANRRFHVLNLGRKLRLPTETVVHRRDGVPLSDERELRRRAREVFGAALPAATVNPKHHRKRLRAGGREIEIQLLCRRPGGVRLIDKLGRGDRIRQRALGVTVFHEIAEHNLCRSNRGGGGSWKARRFRAGDSGEGQHREGEPSGVCSWSAHGRWETGSGSERPHGDFALL